MREILMEQSELNVDNVTHFVANLEHHVTKNLHNGHIIATVITTLRIR